MLRVLTFAALVVLAAAITVSERLAFWFAGFKPLRQLEATAIDDPVPPDDTEAPQFLAERNRVEIVVPRDMPLGELLELYHLAEFPHVRRDIASQEGGTELGALGDDYLLRQGRRYTISLTPPSPTP